MPPVHFGDLKMTRIRIRPHMHNSLTLSYDRLHEQGGCLFEFNPSVYSQRLLREFLDHLIAFTRNAASDPSASIGALIEADGIGAALRARNPGVAR
jgi:hypothetical protein